MSFTPFINNNESDENLETIAWGNAVDQYSKYFPFNEQVPQNNSFFHLKLNKMTFCNYTYIDR